MYLFQALPIWIPASTFNMFDKIINNFIWQRRKPRIRQKLLLSPREKGGLGLPNLKLYWAAQLRVVVEWLGQDEETNWISLENNAGPLVPPEAIPFMEGKHWKDLKIENEWINCTYRVWSLVRKKIGAPSTISRIVKIAKITDFFSKQTG
uniref:POL2 n=1 Tax=Poeciliopsis prolifica TaxID=188132 RepID=A0A0S7EFB4_9TELE